MTRSEPTSLTQLTDAPRSLRLISQLSYSPTAMLHSSTSA